MGRKKKSKISGTVNWSTVIRNIKLTDKKLVQRIASELGTEKGKKCVGDLLTEWITKEAQKEAKRLNLS